MDPHGQPQRRGMPSSVDEGEWEIINDDDEIPDVQRAVTIDDHYGNKHEIQHVPQDKLIRGLGYKMTSQNQGSRFKTTKKQTIEIRQQLQQCGQMAAGDVWLLLQTRVLAAISYPMALTSFTAKQ